MKKTSELETYKTIGALAMVLAIVSQLLERPVFLWIATGLLLLNILLPSINQVISYYWLYFAEKIGKLNSTIILTIVFFFILSPIAFFYRLFHKKQYARYNKDTELSYFEKINKGIVKRDFLKQW